MIGKIHFFFPYLSADADIDGRCGNGAEENLW